MATSKKRIEVTMAELIAIRESLYRRGTKIEEGRARLKLTARECELCGDIDRASYKRYLLDKWLPEDYSYCTAWNAIREIGEDQPSWCRALENDMRAYKKRVEEALLDAEMREEDERRWRDAAENERAQDAGSEGDGGGADLATGMQDRKAEARMVTADVLRDGETGADKAAFEGKSTAGGAAEHPVGYDETDWDL